LFAPATIEAVSANADFAGDLSAAAHLITDLLNSVSRLGGALVN